MLVEHMRKLLNVEDPLAIKCAGSSLALSKIIILIIFIMIIMMIIMVMMMIIMLRLQGAVEEGEGATLLTLTLLEATVKNCGFAIVIDIMILIISISIISITASIISLLITSINIMTIMTMTQGRLPPAGLPKGFPG